MDELFTQRLRLRPLSTEHRNFYVSLYSDSEVMRHIGPALTRPFAHAAFNRARELSTLPGTAYRVWVLVKDVRFVGLLGLRTTAPERGEIGAMLVAEARGYGLAAEAILRLITHAFNELKFETLTTQHSRQNPLAYGLMLKLGFVSTNSMTSGDECRWELSKAEFVARKLPHSD